MTSHRRHLPRSVPGIRRKVNGNGPELPLQGRRPATFTEVSGFPSPGTACNPTSGFEE